MAAYKKIQGNPIKPQGGKPANFSNPHHFRGTVKSVGNVKGGPDLGGVSKNEYFMKSGANGRVSIRGGQKAC